MALARSIAGKTILSNKPLLKAAKAPRTFPKSHAVIIAGNCNPIVQGTDVAIIFSTVLGNIPKDTPSSPRNRFPR